MTRLAAKPDTLPAQSEADFQRMVVDMAHRLGWVTFSVRQAAVHFGKGADRKDMAFVTSGGWPDLVLCKPPKLLFAELKSEKKGAKVSPEQEEWIAWLKGCNEDVRVWSPRDWPEIEATLKGEA